MAGVMVPKIGILGPYDNLLAVILLVQSYCQVNEHKLSSFILPWKVVKHKELSML